MPGASCRWIPNTSMKVNAIRLENAVKSVIGVQAATVSNRSCLVKGDFNVVSVLKAINEAGFSASEKNNHSNLR
jgi:hypothetical protein